MDRILLFIDSLGAGGAQRQFAGLACLLKDRGYDVHVLTYFYQPFYSHLLDSASVSHEVVVGADNHFKRIPLIRKAINSYKPTVVIAYQETPSLIASIIKTLGAKWKLIVSERNTTQVNTWRERVRFNLYRVADYVVPNSYSQGEFIRQNYGFLAHKVVVVHNFVDLDKFKPTGLYVPNLKREIIVVSSISYSKNTKNFINAIGILRDICDKPFHISWYGVEDARPYLTECLSLIKELGLADYISLLPKTKSIAEKYQSADIFCLPSLFEGTPNALCEAISCGLPSACSNVCDNPRYVSKRINGDLFNPLSADSMAEVLKDLICSDDKSLISMSKRSLEVAKQSFDISRFGNAYVELIEEK